MRTPNMLLEGVTDEPKMKDKIAQSWRMRQRRDFCMSECLLPMPCLDVEHLSNRLTPLTFLPSQSHLQPWAHLQGWLIFSIYVQICIFIHTWISNNSHCRSDEENASDAKLRLFKACQIIKEMRHWRSWIWLNPISSTTGWPQFPCMISRVNNFFEIWNGCWSGQLRWTRHLRIFKVNNCNLSKQKIPL